MTTLSATAKFHGSCMDVTLYSERIGWHDTQCRLQARVFELPDEAMVLVDNPRAAFLIQQRYLYLWSAAGYLKRSTILLGQLEKITGRLAKFRNRMMHLVRPLIPNLNDVDATLETVEQLE